MTAALDALLARLDALVAKRVAQVEPFRAVVKSVTGGGLVTIRRVESAADDAEEYARVAGFTLAVNDEVVCILVAGKPVVVGRLQRTAISDLDLTVQDLTITGSLTGGGAGLAIDADTGFLKLGASSAVPVTISQSGQTTTIGGKLYQQGGEPVPFMDGSKTVAQTFTSTTEASVVESVGSYALTAGSVVKGFLWGFYGNTSGTATLTLALRQNVTDVVTIVIPTVSAQSNSTGNPFWIQFHCNVLTTTTATAIAHATTVTSNDAEGDVSTNRIDLSANAATISSAATAWNISADWSTTTGTPTATIMGGYLEFVIV